MEIIAEIGQNHNGDMGLAKELIQVAKDCGADVAKFQLFDMSFWEKIYLANPEIKKEWKEYHTKTCLSTKDITELKNFCDNLNIEFMTSVFDVKFVNFLETINVQRYKIASNTIDNKDLINKICSTNKDIIISLGSWKKDEFPKINTQGKKYYLYCISKYPTPLEELNFNKINFNKYDGFSDHTIGINASLIALSRGAQIIEKHITIDKKMFGPDHIGSIDPYELSKLVKFKNDLEISL